MSLVYRQSAFIEYSKAFSKPPSNSVLERVIESVMKTETPKIFDRTINNKTKIELDILGDSFV
ncbi:CLUMA_CG011259, isoform A [Clunio marinus]|uniref:CLUMA_CG011259, isoform A n=1 Tax=Clunio marinus TaxID=568069 RepID=A0A1J1IEA2_9DIPT|nr:CLUMA_CG011259, isoform A [Clunio marinus]